MAQYVRLTNNDPFQVEVASSSRRGMWHKVTKDPESDAWDCTCERYCWTGIVCKHIAKAKAFKATYEPALAILAERGAVPA